MGGRNSFASQVFNPGNMYGWNGKKGGNASPLANGFTASPEWIQQVQMMQFLSNQANQQQNMQNEALAAERQAIKNAQIQNAQSAQNQGEQQAKQQLGLENQSQQAKDAGQLAAEQKIAQGAGTAATGGAYNLPNAQANQLSNLRGAAAGLPQTAANQAGSGMPPMNPAGNQIGNSENTIQPTNQGKQFGGY